MGYWLWFLLSDRDGHLLLLHRSYYKTLLLFRWRWSQILETLASSISWRLISLLLKHSIHLIKPSILLILNIQLRCLIRAHIITQMRPIITNDALRVSGVVLTIESLTCTLTNHSILLLWCFKILKFTKFLLVCHF